MGQVSSAGCMEAGVGTYAAMASAQMDEIDGMSWVLLLAVGSAQN